MRKIKKIYKSAFTVLLVCSNYLVVSAQNTFDLDQQEFKMDYSEFISKLFEKNLSYAAQKYDIDIAIAQFEAAKILPDPELSFAWFDNQQKRLDMGYGFEAEISWDLELGGKRKARKELAFNQKELAELELRDYFENLRAQSTLVYLKALRDQVVVNIQKSSYESMLQVAQSDSIRFKLGQISQVAAVQSKLEAANMLHDLQDAILEYKQSILELNSLINNTKYTELFIPIGDFESFSRLFSLEELLEKALVNRSDVLVAKQGVIVGEKEISLAKAERVIDLGLSLGVENNSYARNIIAPTPSHTVVKAGISVPLKFSNSRESGLKTAIYQQAQAQLGYQELQLETIKEVTTAFENYLIKQNQIRRYEKGMLLQAKEVFEGIRYSYLRGASSLLEVLEAQRTYNETQLSYASTLLEYATSLVELEKSVGIWDINF
ncbi:TolC family protein [Myroides sp. LJL119]